MSAARADPGECLKLSVHLGERDRGPDGLAADVLLERFAARGAAVSVLLRGGLGFEHSGRMRSDRLLTLSEDLPVTAIALDAPERIEALAADAAQIAGKGLVTIERARWCGADAGGAVGERLAGEPELKLTAFTGRRERAGRRPAYVAACEVLHAHGLAGAAVLLGVDGTRGERRLRARFFAANAAVPVIVVGVGSGEAVTAALGELGELLPRSPMTCERIRVCKRDGRRLSTPPALRESGDPEGLAPWQRLTVYASESARHDGRPLHSEIVRGLRRIGADGATSVRGVWGFHGAHSPHGDRLMQIRRHVPLVTETIDAPDRIARSFALIDELTAETGLVTCETVPAGRVLGSVRGGGLRPAAGGAPQP